MNFWPIANPGTIAVVVVAISLSACSAINIPSAAKISDTHKVEKQHLCGTKNIPTRTSKSRKGFNSDIRYMRFGNKYIADIPGLERYANTVLDNLKACGSAKTNDSKVVIFLSPNFEAYTLEHSTIFVSLGAIMKLRSEDELAALLAHEYSHVALGHHKKDRIEKVTSTASSLTKGYLEYFGGDTSGTDLTKVKIAEWLSENALFPSWNRNQESAADQLGLNLLIQAGYNGDAFLVMLKNIGESIREQQSLLDRVWEANKSANNTVDSAMSSGMSILNLNLSENYKQTSERSDELRMALDEYPERSRNPLLAAEYRKAISDPKIVSRISYYGAVMTANRVLSESPSKAAQILKSRYRASGEDSYVHMTQYYLHQTYNRMADAENALHSAYSTGHAPASAYFLLAKNAEKKKDYSVTYDYYRAIDKDFDKPKDILPEMIRLGNRLNKLTYHYEARCFASLDADLIDRCKQAR